MVRSHKGTSTVDPTPQRPTSRHWDDFAPGSGKPPPGSESTTSGSPRSRQDITCEAETGKNDLSNHSPRHVTVHCQSLHDPDNQQSVQSTGKNKCHSCTLHNPRHESQTGKGELDHSGLLGHSGGHYTLSLHNTSTALWARHNSEEDAGHQPSKTNMKISKSEPVQRL